MIITVNTHDYTLPDSLEEIALGRQEEFMSGYGTALDAEREEILQRAFVPIDNNAETDEATLRERYESEKEIALTLNLIDRAYATVAFYSGCDIDELKDAAELTEVMTAYVVTDLVIAAEQREIMVEPRYSWKGSEWLIQAPYTPEEMATLSYDNFKALQQLARGIVDFSKGNWTGVRSLCCAYFRMVDEPFTPALLTGGRRDDMGELPLSIVLGVLTFIEATMTLHASNLRSYMENATDDVDPGTDERTDDDGDPDYYEPPLDDSELVGFPEPSEP